MTAARNALRSAPGIAGRNGLLAAGRRPERRLTRKFTELRERFGISSFLVDDLDALAPVVEELAGR